MHRCVHTETPPMLSILIENCNRGRKGHLKQAKTNRDNEAGVLQSKRKFAYISGSKEEERHRSPVHNVTFLLL